jgi:uncharacterized protein with HEPN domain
MTRRDDSVSMRQMLDHAREAVQFTDGKSFTDLLSDRMLALAIVQLLGIVGEAATRVSPATRAKHRTIPWRQMIGLRNRLAHEYDTINLQIVWEIITEDLPPLIVELEHVLEPNRDNRDTSAN